MDRATSEALIDNVWSIGVKHLDLFSKNTYHRIVEVIENQPKNYNALLQAMRLSGHIKNNVIDFILDLVEERNFNGLGYVGICRLYLYVKNTKIVIGEYFRPRNATEAHMAATNLTWMKNHRPFMVGVVEGSYQSAFHEQAIDEFRRNWWKFPLEQFKDEVVKVDALIMDDLNRVGDYFRESVVAMRIDELMPSYGLVMRIKSQAQFYNEFGAFETKIVGKFQHLMRDGDILLVMSSSKGSGYVVLGPDGDGCYLATIRMIGTSKIPESFLEQVERLLFAINEK
ncbi:hypothetical protein [Vibrio barjaei]|uniref:hypothetical protein n=1 Tax=Vibrio barjaei TaxID=1676683 RepID=UPI002284092F|nr:hypothetical protein [Vibrio barjaei]MCY9870398.1 hypothetical protein [Vibrio barjaei]